MDASCSRRTVLQGVGLGCLMGLSFGQAGCTRDAAPGVGSVRDKGSASAVGSAESVAGVIAVTELPKGEELWSETVSNASELRFASSSCPLIIDDAVYVSGRGEICAYKLKDGRFIADGTLPDMDYTGARTAFAKGLVLIAYGDGSVAAFDAADLSLVWRQRYGFVKGVRETGSGTREDGSTYATSEEFDADWYATDIIVHETAAIVGFSSYSTNPGSYLMCIDLADGSVRWQHEHAGRFCYHDGVSHPCATPAGVLAVVPEEPRLQLLDYGDGHVIGENATDSLIGMGFSPVPGTEDSYLTATRDGCLLYLRVSADGVERVASALLPVPDGAERALMPSCAQPVAIGDFVVCNLPVPSEMRNDGREIPKDGATNGIAVLELNGFEVRSRLAGLSFEATPVILQGRYDTVPHLYYLQSDGLWRMPFENGEFGDPELLNGDVRLGLDTQRGPFSVDADGMLALVCGDTDTQRLHVLC